MIGNLVIAFFAFVAGCLYGRMQSRRAEDDLRFELACWEDRCRVLKARLKAREAS